MDPLKFDMWAPNPQPVDYAPMMQASAARMHALTQLGSDIGAGIEEAAKTAERNRRENDTESAIKSLASPDLTESFTRMPAEVLYPDILEHVLNPVNRKKFITGELMQRGLDQEHAAAQAEEYLTPRTYRYYNEAGRQKIAAVMAKGVSRGTFTPQQFHEILASGNTFEDLQTALSAQTTAWKAPELDQREALLFQSQIKKSEMGSETAEIGKRYENEQQSKLTYFPMLSDLQNESEAKLQERLAQIKAGIEEAQGEKQFGYAGALESQRAAVEERLTHIRGKYGLQETGIRAEAELGAAGLRAQATKRGENKLTAAQKVDLNELVAIRNSAESGEAKPQKDVTLLNALSGEDFNALVAKVSDKFGVLPGMFPDPSQFQDIHVSAAPGNKVKVTVGTGSTGSAEGVRQLLIGAFGSEALASRAVAAQQFAPLNSPRGSTFQALLDKLRTAPRKSPRVLNVFEDLYQRATAGETQSTRSPVGALPGSDLLNQ